MSEEILDGGSLTPLEKVFWTLPKAHPIQKLTCRQRLFTEQKYFTS